MNKLFKNLIILTIILLSCKGAFCYTLTQNELYKIINQKLSSQIKFDEFELKISGIPNEKIITNDVVAPKIEIISQNQSFQPHSFKKVIVKDANNNVVRTFPINVQTLVYKNVLVASQQISFGSEINSSNSKIEKKEISKYLDKTLFSIPSNTIASRNYSEGSIILNSGIKQKAIMLKNSTIDIVFISKKGMKIIVQGKALKDGSLGEYILVKSDKYNRTYNAVVNSEKEVIVRI